MHIEKRSWKCILRQKIKLKEDHMFQGVTLFCARSIQMALVCPLLASRGVGWGGGGELGERELSWHLPIAQLPAHTLPLLLFFCVLQSQDLTLHSR